MVSRGWSVSRTYLGWAKNRTIRCPYCNGRLMHKRITKEVWANTEEAEDFDMSGVDDIYCDVKTFTYDIFECESCKEQIETQRVKKCEDAIKRMEKKQNIYEMGTIISYLYEDTPIDVHKDKLYCNACNKKLLLDSVEVENSEKSKYKYCYTPWMQIEDEHTEFQLKKYSFIVLNAIKNIVQKKLEN